MRLEILLTVAMGCCTLAGCQRNISPDTYAVGSVGQVNQAVRGVVINVRPVNVSGNRSGLGAGVGAVGGGIAGSTVGRSQGTALGVLGGAVLGGIVGATAEEAATRQTGVEYVIQTENGNLLTIVQGPDPVLSVKQKVLVIYGSQARVIADPSS